MTISAFRNLGTVFANADPDANADISLGIVNGQQWFNTVSKVTFICTSNANGAATWDDIGTSGGGSFQPLDADLTAIAALVSAANKLAYATGAGTWAMTDLTAAGRALLDDADATAQRATLGLVIGTDVQAQDADLSAIAALTSAANKIAYATGAGTWALTDFTAAARTLLAAADAAAQRTALGLVIGTDVPAQTHATQHKSGGSDAIKIDDLAAPDDNTDLNASASAHGLQAKLSGLVLDVQAGDGTWNPTGQFDIDRQLQIYDDFMTALNSDNFLASVSGTAAANNSTAGVPEQNHPGIVQHQTGTDSTGRAGFFSNNMIRFGGGQHTAKVMAKITTLSDGTDRFLYYAGCTNAFGAESSNGAYFRYTDNVNSGKFECVCRANSVETAADSGVTVVAGTWYGLMVVVDATAAEAKFYISTSGGAWTLVATITTNIPNSSSRIVSGCSSIIRKTLGSTSRTVDLDYMYARYRFTTPRATP